MDKHFIKQLIYGSGYLSIIFLFLIIFYFIFLKSAPTCFDNKQNQNETEIDCGGVCVPCDLKNALPLENSWIKYFSANNKAVLTAHIKNSNLNYGADSFSYSFKIYDKNKNEIRTIKKKSFIYNSDVKYLIEITDIDYSIIGGVNLIFSDIIWKTKEELKKPKIIIREKSTKASDNGEGVEVSGIIKNDSPFSLSKATLVGFLNNNNGIKIGASKTELENFNSFGEKFFKIFFPINIKVGSPEDSFFNVNLADPNKTEVYIDAR
ncbi:hypothetical protein HZB04_04055 [Candidatus Wolfebacteria bacterium]|nr:hypothetical protein [Candidatus Wolfebacteria bacterium]